MVDDMFDKWPDWLRWVIFVPFSAVGAVLAAFLVRVIVSFRGDPGVWAEMLQAAAMTYLFIILLSGIAPVYKFTVALIGAGVAVALLGALVGFVVFGAVAGIEIEWTFWLIVAAYIAGIIPAVIVARNEQ